MKQFLSIMLFIACSAPLYAQDCNTQLTGEVLDFHDKTPLEGAQVYIPKLQKTVITNSKGKFTFKNLCDGIYELEVSHFECTTRFLKVEVFGNTFKRITLEHHIEELDEVSVTGRKVRTTNSAQEQTITNGQLERYSSATLGDALKQVSGVSSLNTGATIVKPVIQGLNGSRVLVLNNGVRMQDMEWGDEHAPNVDINSAGKVTVVKGASALRYGGDAIGGVIVLEPLKTLAIDSLYGKTILSGSTNGRGGGITSELVKTYKSGWFLKGQGSFKRFGDLEAPDYVLSNTGVKEGAFSVSAGKRSFYEGWDAMYSFFNTEIGVLAASHIGNVDDLITAINSDEPLIIRDFTYDIGRPQQEVTHHLGRARYYKRFEGFGKLTLQYDFQRNERFEFDVNRRNNDNSAAIDLELTTHTAQADFVIDANSDYKIETGILYRYQDNFADPSTGVRRLIPDYTKNDAAIYLTGKYLLNDAIVIDAGFRYDYSKIDALKFYRNSRWIERGYQADFGDRIVEQLNTQLLVNPVFDFSNISATAGLKYNFNSGTEFLFNYALAQRAPNPAELFSDGLHHSAARIELGDLRIGKETSNKISLSLLHDYEHWGWEVSPYANFIADFILLEPTSTEFTIRGAFPVWEYRQTDARLLGVDASAYVNWSKHWKTNHQFSLVKGRDVGTDIPLINIPAANTKNRITYTHHDWHNLTLGLESQYVFRQNETPDDIDVFSPVTNENVLLAINTAPDAYHLLHFDAEIAFAMNNESNLKVRLAVNNLLDTNYRDYLNRQRYFADDLGRNISLQLKINY
ncbi:TonB-dependent receptor [Spongiivirga citrea]|uniref:TonB-dependent receptor n=1 Tax=Spongiivirga citrea TaxID=1481457 RepID=A0A6M0CQ37_9FLAO|nr:TonB-dependent receptor [Spongiivirga citrea]NER19033.1 TonB-dependent receptor [Spongiivirga citrea]